jgi:hypothetical protein
MVAQTSVGVFGLIGFGGQPGREGDGLTFEDIAASQSKEIC